MATAWIVGGTRGIGRAVADELWQRGWTVVAGGRHAGELAEVSERRWVVGVDTRSAVEVDAARDRILRDLELDAVINCAGASTGGSIMTLTEQDWTQAIETKLLGYVRVCRAVLPGLAPRGGTLVNVIGSAAAVAEPDYAIGCLAAALVHVTRGVAQEWCRAGARVFGVNPGPTRTERLDTLIDTAARRSNLTTAEAEAEFAGAAYTGRPLRPEAVARLVADLLGPTGEPLNGTVLLADGGTTGGWI